MKTLKFETQHGTCEIVPYVTEAMSLSSNGNTDKSRKVFDYSVYVNGVKVFNWLYNLPKDQLKTFHAWRDENERAIR